MLSIRVLSKKSIKHTKYNEPSKHTFKGLIMILYAMGSTHEKYRDNTLLAAVATFIENLPIGGEGFIDHAENVKGEAVSREHLRATIYKIYRDGGRKVVTSNFDLYGLWVKAV